MLKYDFREVEKNYPKAFEKFKSFLSKLNYVGLYKFSKDGDIKFIGGTVFNPRDLYDYFDQQGIIGHTDCFWEEPFNIQNWSFSIEIYGDVEKNNFYFQESKFSTRPEAETALWNKCFEILEERLTNANN